MVGINRCRFLSKILLADDKFSLSQFEDIELAFQDHVVGEELIRKPQDIIEREASLIGIE